jgi:hypothetical protein
MSVIEAAVATALLMIFLVGIACGFFLTACLSSVIEDKKYSLRGRPPGPACGGTRIVVGFSTREVPPGSSPRYSGRRPRQGRGLDK